MRLPRVALVLVAASAALGAGCQSPDVGQRCQIPSYPGSTLDPKPTEIDGDFLETGNPACDSLVCIASPVKTGEYSSCDGTQCGYCSKPCVSDAECFESETGLVCRQLVLDPAYISYLETQLAPDGSGRTLADIYLGEARYSRYCAVPL
jgi:hypothetical protein